MIVRCSCGARLVGAKTARARADYHEDKRYCPQMAAMHGVASSPASVTRVRMCQVLTPADCNKLNSVALGPVLRWMDIAACLSAEKLALTCCVTLSMDHLLFDNSLLVEQGTTILIEAQVSAR